jgi:hypothetical protein
VLGEGFDGGFGGVVGGVAGGVGDALLRAGDDDACGGGGGGVVDDEGQEGVEAVDDAEEVYVDDLVEVGAVGPGAFAADPGVQGEEGDAGLGDFGLDESFGVSL